MSIKKTTRIFKRHTDKKAEKDHKSTRSSSNNSQKAGNGMMEVVFILDRSGSMSGMEMDTIGGFNSMLKQQKAESDNVIWSTVLFDHMHEVIHNRVPISKVEPLTEEDYYVRGCTALLDAIGRAISHIAIVHKYGDPELVPEKTLFVITTDGMENSSMEYSYDQVRRMIEKEKEKYGWEFLFLGANIDAVSVAARMGIGADRSATFINDSEGIQKNYAAFGQAMASMSRMEELDGAVLDSVRADYSRRSRGRR